MTVYCSIRTLDSEHFAFEQEVKLWDCQETYFSGAEYYVLDLLLVFPLLETIHALTVHSKCQEIRDIVEFFFFLFM